MKIALLTDTHWGVRSDNVSFLDNSKKFLDEVFFPTLEQLNINTVIHLGDLVDRRKYININTANRLRQDFLDVLKDMNINAHFIMGNHDCYYKNNNNINALTELIKDKYPFKLYTHDAEEVEFDHLPILIVPWISDHNIKQVMEKINETKSQVCFGHFEIQGFEMYKGSIVSHGTARDFFNKFDVLISGHYHHRSSDGHIFYLGSHAEFTWSDYNDDKGFHIFDTETRELTFIKNPFKMFRKIWYSDIEEDFDYTTINYEQYRGSIIKVIIQNKTNPYVFDKFIECLENVNPIDLQIVEDHLNLNLEDDINIVNEAESTLTIFKTYVDTTSFKGIDKGKLNNKLTQLYNRALASE